eukprot:scaffold9537_cov140-Isochrysis_galbana.AAC.1
MPLNAYGGFKRMTGFCKTRIPPALAAKVCAPSHHAALALATPHCTSFSPAVTGGHATVTSRCLQKSIAPTHGCGRDRSLHHTAVAPSPRSRLEKIWIEGLRTSRPRSPPPPCALLQCEPAPRGSAAAPA